MSRQTALLIWGASGHAAVVADVVRCEGRYDIAGCIDDLNPQKRRTLAGEVLGASDLLADLRRQGVTHILVGIGDGAVRRRLAVRAVAMGFELATAVHPRATCAKGVTLGPGTVLMAGSVVNPGATLGSNVIINTCASVDHECQLGDGVHICPGTHLAGSVIVGEGTMIGIGSAVRDRVRIGKECIIGAGAAVVSDVPDHSLVVGVPGRVVRSLR